MHYLDKRYRENPSVTVDDVELVEALGVAIEEVRRQLDILEAEGNTRSANTFGAHSAYLSPRGLALADELREQLEAPPSKGTGIGFDRERE